MQTQPATDDFPDLKSHVSMYGRYSGLMMRGTIAVVVLLLFIGWITGVL